jgi:hypothetical protein
VTTLPQRPTGSVERGNHDPLEHVDAGRPKLDFIEFRGLAGREFRRAALLEHVEDVFQVFPPVLHASNPIDHRIT